ANAKAAVPLALAILSAALVHLTATRSTAKPLTPLSEPVKVRVLAEALSFDRDDARRTKFGKLTYRGGINLFARSSHFGGFSGLALDPTGTALLAITDAGAWMQATLDYEGKTLTGLSEVTLGPILDTDGTPVSSTNRQDAEGLALLAGTTREGTALVSFERDHRIGRYPFSPARFGPPDGAISLPKAASAMEDNMGLEALAILRGGPLKGTVVALAERLKDRNGNLTGWLIGGPETGSITIKRLGGFDITDAAGLPDGGLLLLERRFRFSEGVKMRIRRIKAADIRRGKLVTGEVLLEADDLWNIDNMEAISVHRAPDGASVLTIMSDDNFNPFQRTLILQFALP
ncbi:MAG: esterase-like activity of phytase family protein, partial [Pseudomonadota bacterium]